MKTISGIEGYKALQGQPLGESEWLQVDQERINQFADATGDHQWIHVDVERAKQGPFGAPIAHGFLTLSLIPTLTGGLIKVDGVRMALGADAADIDIRSSKETYLRRGPFSTQEMLDFWDDSVGGSLHAEGFPFARSAGETTWTLKELPGLYDFLTYEAELNRFLPRYPQVIMCLYDLDRFGGQVRARIVARRVEQRALRAVTRERVASAHLRELRRCRQQHGHL